MTDLDGEQSVKRATMMVLRGGARALGFVVLGVLVYSVVTDLNIGGTFWKGSLHHQ